MKGISQLYRRLRQMNYELNRLETIHQKPEMVSYPVVVQLPTGTRCNLRCVFCTDRSPEASGSYRHMSLEEFVPLSEVLAYAMVVQLWGWGEPFCNPEYGRIFDHTTHTYPGIEINISTNGTLLDASWIKKLLDYGQVSLNVSLNAATGDSYRSVAGMDLFDQVVTNLKTFSQMRAELKWRPRPQLSVSFVVVKNNLDEIADFIDLAAQVGADYVQFMDLMHINNDCEGVPQIAQEKARQLFEEAGRRAAVHGIPMGSFLAYSTSEYLSKEKLRAGSCDQTDTLLPRLGPCYEPWKTLLVCSDGTATLCCRSGVVVGNVLTEGVDAVWNGNMYSSFRKSVNSPHPPEICRVCPTKLRISS